MPPRPALNDLPPEAPAPPPPDRSRRRRAATATGELVLNFVRGFCMGTADTVPGVSGGTVALILGHYDRLVAAIGNVDLQLLTLARQKRWAAIGEKLDFRLMIPLGIGILAAIVTLAGLMHWLLDHRLQATLATFLGLIAASVWVVRREVTRWSTGPCIGVAAGILIALALGWVPATSGDVGLAWLFFSATIAICAMILPGISGAFILLLLGSYEPVLSMVRGLSHGELDAATLLRLAVFAVGCLTGLLTFSRLLKYLLAHHRDQTIAVLIGLMIGSIDRLYPLQIPTVETAGLEFKDQQLVSVWPGDYDGSILMLVGLAIAGAAVVLIADRIAGGGEAPSEGFG